MSTTPTPLTPNPTLLPTWVHSVVALVKAHEKLAGIIIVGLFVSHYAIRVDGMYHDYLKTKGTAQQVIVKQDDTQLIALQTQLAATQAQSAKAMALLSAQIAAGQQQLKQQQQIDAKLPLPQLSSRWSTLIGQNAAAIVPTNQIPSGTDITNTITVSADAAHATVSKLEEIPQLTQELSATNSELTTCKNLVTATNAVTAAQGKELVDEKKSHADDVKTLKDENHRSWMKGFKWGAVAGFVGGIFVMHKI